MHLHCSLLLTVDVTGWVVSSSGHSDFPAMVDWHLELGAKINPISPEVSLYWFCKLVLFTLFLLLCCWHTLKTFQLGFNSLWWKWGLHLYHLPYINKIVLISYVPNLGSYFLWGFHGRGCAVPVFHSTHLMWLYLESRFLTICFPAIARLHSSLISVSFRWSFPWSLTSAASFFSSGCDKNIWEKKLRELFI